ncbi:hypothetical protein CLU79DRAFT_752063 [Phycomyces nitens]|nr:hypothetical protein CLU79DRAFT_752063 [Phycomyces nitens]
MEDNHQREIDVQTILHCGWIYYYSPSRFRSSWKKRYLVLTSLHLRFYKSSKSSLSTEAPDMSFPITQCKHVQPHQGCKRSKYALWIDTTHPQHSQIAFYCKSEPESNAWKEILSLQIMANYPTINEPSGRRIKTVSTLDKWLNRSYPLIGSSLSDPPMASAPVPSQSTPVPHKPNGLFIAIPNKTIHTTNPINRRPLARDIWKNANYPETQNTYTILLPSIWDTPLPPPPRRCMTVKSTHARNRPPSIYQYNSRISATLASPTFGCKVK